MNKSTFELDAEVVETILASLDGVQTKGIDSSKRIYTAYESIMGQFKEQSDKNAFETLKTKYENKSGKNKNE